MEPGYRHGERCHSLRSKTADQPYAGKCKSRHGSQSADGYYHPEDEVHLPWFMRLAPNTVSEPTQSPSANVGRYTFLGDLNPFPGFREPATGCN